MEDRRNVGESSCNSGDGTDLKGPIIDVDDDDPYIGIRIQPDDDVWPTPKHVAQCRSTLDHRSSDCLSPFLSLQRTAHRTLQAARCGLDAAGHRRLPFVMSHGFAVCVSVYIHVGPQNYGFSCPDFEGASECWTVLFYCVFYRGSSTCGKYGYKFVFGH